MTDQNTSTGLLLFAHGARDARWAEPFLRLQDKVAQTHSGPVRLCFLELMSPSLAEAATTMIEAGCKKLVVLPIFFGRGGHIRRDLPALLDELRLQHPNITIECADAAGENEGVLNALAAYCMQAASL